MTNNYSSFPVFENEKKLQNNFFFITENARNFIIRLFPFAIYEIDGQYEDIKNDLISSLKFEFEETLPFTYFQPLLILTNSCNLACTYCYAYKGSYGYKAECMSNLVIDKTMEFLYNTISEKFEYKIHPDKEYELGAICFGGEPLIVFDKVEYAYYSLKRTCSELSNKFKTSFKPLLTVNTNGFVITEDQMLFFREIKNNLELVVSFDGWTHDDFRLTAENKNTSQNVIENIVKLKKIGIDISVTSCILPKAVKESEKTIEGLKILFENDIPVNLSFIRGSLETVKDFAAYPGIIQESYNCEELLSFGKEIAKLISEGKKIYTKRYLKRLLEGGYRYRCGAGLFEFAVMPNGDVFPCHNFISGNSIIGNILNDNFEISTDNKLISDLFKRKVVNLLPCSDCVFQSSCMSSFDCPAHSLQDCGDLNKVDVRFCSFARQIQGEILKTILNHGE